LYAINSTIYAMRPRVIAFMYLFQQPQTAAYPQICSLSLTVLRAYQTRIFKLQRNL